MPDGAVWHDDDRCNRQNARRIEAVADGRNGAKNDAEEARPGSCSSNLTYRKVLTTRICKK